MALAVLAVSWALYYLYFCASTRKLQERGLAGRSATLQAILWRIQKNRKLTSITMRTLTREPLRRAGDVRTPDRTLLLPRVPRSRPLFRARSRCTGRRHTCVARYGRVV